MIRNFWQNIILMAIVAVVLIGGAWLLGYEIVWT